VDDWSELPLFPLDTVLFPGMVLPLHIFEERYKQMISCCVAGERPFGVVLIEQGQETGGDAVPCEVGTTAVIAAVSRLDDGRMNIVTIGSERFRLREVRHGLPYLVGSAEPWPLTGSDAALAWESVAPVQARFARYLKSLSQAQGHEIKIEEVPGEPRALALLIAIALQVPMSQKQQLLLQPTVGEMLGAERVLLLREQMLLDYIVRTQSQQWEGGHSGYLATN
jgi:uncharacterized protein